MAGIHISAVTAAITLTSATAKTILQLVAATNQRVVVNGFSVSFAGNSGTAVPVKVRILRQTTAGTMSSLTPKALQPITETIQTTAQHTATAEPTAGDVLRTFHIHPQTGGFPPFRCEIPGGGRLGMECTAPAGVDVIGEFMAEE